MNIKNLTEKSIIYTSNAWLCSCDGDVQTSGTLIDTGCDPSIFEYLRALKKRTGRNPVNQIILTHNHYDHARLLGDVREEFNSIVYGFSAYASGIDHVLIGGDVLMCGNYHFEVIAIPGHTSDSVCIYCLEREILFSGDTPMTIWGTENTYEQAFLQGFEELATKKIQAIYPGHGDIIHSGAAGIIKESLTNLKKSKII